MNDMNHIFLSPHLDDAILSCGGMIYQLAQSGQPVQVVTIFTGDPPACPLSPFAQSLHDRWGAAPVNRRDEDVEALRLLGAEAIRWPYSDAVYRCAPDTDRPLYASEESIFGEVSAADATVIAAIADRLSRIDLSKQLYVPLAAGHHVDHQVVRAAAESLGRVLIYYEDYPYAETPEKLDAALRDRPWVPEIFRLSDEAIRMKAKAINAYRSQISTFFKDEAEVEQRIRAYASLVGGQAGASERVWRLPYVSRML